MSIPVAMIIGVVIGAVAATAAVFVYASCVVSGECSEAEEQAEFFYDDEPLLDIPLWEDDK